MRCAWLPAAIAAVKTKIASRDVTPNPYGRAASRAGERRHAALPERGHSALLYARGAILRGHRRIVDRRCEERRALVVGERAHRLRRAAEHELPGVDARARREQRAGGDQ